MTYYHGTSSAVQIRGVIFPPSVTNNQREDFRTKHTDQVFLTDSIVSARKYAKSSCQKYGGNPVVYTVVPIGNKWKRKDTEYLADYALVLRKYGM